MDTAISRAVGDYVSSATSSCYVHFPELSDFAWDACLSCTEPELNAKRSAGFLVFAAYLDKLVRLAARKDPRGNFTELHIRLLRQVILSDHVLALLMANAGTASIRSPQDEREASRALFVLADSVVMDGGGLREFGVWFFDVFKGIASVALDACRRMQVSQNMLLVLGRRTGGSSQLAEGVRPTPSKRILVSHGGERASKRRRTGASTSVTTADTSPSNSTLQILQRLRQRQMLAATSDSVSLSIVLGSPGPSTTQARSFSKQLAFFSGLPTEQEQLEEALPPCTTPTKKSVSTLYRTSEAPGRNTKPQLNPGRCLENDHTESRSTDFQSQMNLSAQSIPNFLLTVLNSEIPTPALQCGVELESQPYSSVSGPSSGDIAATQSDTRYLGQDLQEAAVRLIEEVWHAYIQDTIDAVTRNQSSTPDTAAQPHEQTIEDSDTSTRREGTAKNEDNIPRDVFGAPGLESRKQGQHSRKNENVCRSNTSSSIKKKTKSKQGNSCGKILPLTERRNANVHFPARELSPDLEPELKIFSGDEDGYEIYCSCSSDISR